MSQDTLQEMMVVSVGDGAKIRSDFLHPVPLKNRIFSFAFETEEGFFYG